MKRITTLSEALTSGWVTVDADGIEVQLSTGQADLSARLDALEYWSGVRDVSALLENGWAGIITLSRVGHSVSLSLDGLSSALATSSIFMSLPSGFRAIKRPGSRVYRTMVTAGGTPATVHSVDIDRWGNVRIFTTTGLDKTFYGSLEFATTDPIPATPPGDPT